MLFFEKRIDGGYIAECVELPGCMSQGDTEEEAKANIVDAIESCIAVLVRDSIQSMIIDRATHLAGVEKSERYVFEPKILVSSPV